MRSNLNFSIWWGPPKKFENRHAVRRVSWLELFFDLVYVMAISRITHHLTGNMSVEGFLEFSCLFIIIYWGWLNGSLHHDLHGNSGLRTRLLTLWQMVIVAALAVVIAREIDDHHHSVTVIFMIMQVFIAYLWWSVGFYDRDHRKYSWPYTLFYSISFGLMALSLFLPSTALKIILPVIFLLNFSPPFITHRIMKRNAQDLDLSSSMFERLGLFTIIIFGELVLGVINGMVESRILNVYTWINFILAMSLVFALWWIFFVMIGTRHAKKNLLRASLLELLYIPTVVSLSLMAAGFPSFFNKVQGASFQIYNYAISIYLICICLLINLLEYTWEFKGILKRMQLSLFITGLIFIITSFFEINFSQTSYLLFTLLLIGGNIAYLNFVYYRQLVRKGLSEPVAQT